MPQGKVTSLEIMVTWMGDRGSKSDSFISVKEQRADGFSIWWKYRKVCSTSLRNSDFIHSLTGIPITKRKQPKLIVQKDLYIELKILFYSCAK